MTENPRKKALSILMSIFYDGKYSNLAVKDGLANGALSGVDKAFVTALVYGVVSRQLTLDAYIEQCSSVKLSKLSRHIHTILRMGVYQIKFMDKIPLSAAVNESVKLAKRFGHIASAGYVNAILRRIAEEELKLPDAPDKRMSVEFSLPEAVCRLWIEEYGEEFARSLAVSLNESPKMYVRTNTLKTTTEELAKMLEDSGVKVLGTESTAIAVSMLDVAKSELYRDGFFTVQDTAPMTAVEVLSPESGQVVADVCAAPGGKTAYIAELMKNNGEVYAFDIYDHKIRLICENAERLGISIINASLFDATNPNEKLFDKCDRVLADVPCSGLGILRRKPDIKWHVDFETITGIQYEILKNSAKLVKKGGRLVYSTCTLNPAENERQIERFLAENKEFSLRPFEARGKACGGMLTLFPNVDGCDGFFIAALERNYD